MKKMPKTPKARVLEEKCKACGLCIATCPQKAISYNQEKFNDNGVHPAKVDKKKCIGCSQCFLVCPEVAIEIYEE